MAARSLSVGGTVLFVRFDEIFVVVDGELNQVV